MTSEISKLGLADALTNNELVYHYQPQVDLLTGQVSGVEALMRWVKADGLILAPGAFLPIAETSGFINEISLAMFDKLLTDIAIIQRVNPLLSMSFNLSALDFATDHFVKKLRFAIGAEKIDPHRLQIELTETTLMNGSPEVRENVQSFIEMGIGLAMDDFGTGYSTIDMLSQWPFTVVKIDQGLIGRIQNDEKSITIVRNSIQMAHQLGLKIVAEGVETEEVYDFLLKAGCSEVQGYHLGHPMPLDELLAFLRVDKRWSGSPIGLIHMAQADHLQWRRQLIDYAIDRLYDGHCLTYAGRKQLELDPFRSLLGQWYYGAGQSYSGVVAYDAMEGKNIRIHHVAQTIVDAIDAGESQANVIAYLREMTEISIEIIGLLQQLELDALLKKGDEVS